MESKIEAKFRGVNITQDCIETLALWVLHYKQHSDLIAKVWLKCVREATHQHKLALLYLCNDVIQRGRRNRPQFLTSFKTVLPDSAPLLMQHDEIKKKVEKVFNVWRTRKVYDEKFLTHLFASCQSKEFKKPLEIPRRSPLPYPHIEIPGPSFLLEGNESPGDEVVDFEPTRLVEQVKKIRKIQEDVNRKMSFLLATKLDISKSDVLASCKDKSHCEQFERDFDEGIRCLKEYVGALESSLSEHRELQNLLDDGSKYYRHQLNEVKLVAGGFKTFAGRVDSVKAGLGRFRIPSPPPLPEECPSPTDSEMDDMVISPVRDEANQAGEYRPKSLNFKPEASFMNSSPEFLSRLKETFFQGSGSKRPSDNRVAGSSVSAPLPPPPMPTGMLAPPPVPPFIGVNPYLSQTTLPIGGGPVADDQDEIKEVDMDLEEEDDGQRAVIPKRVEEALAPPRQSNLIELTSKDVDFRVRPPLLPLPTLCTDVDDRFPRRGSGPEQRVELPRQHTYTPHVRNVPHPI